MDDTLYLAAARQIHAAPGHPYDFDFNWFGHPVSMWRATQNPPLLSYGLAGLQALGLTSERALHLAFLVFPLASLIFTFQIAGRFCRHPGWVSVVMFAAPAFFVSATNLMADLPLLAFMLGAVCCWLFALERGGRGWWIAASVLVAMAVLTKYFGAALFVLLPLLSWSRGRLVGRHLLALVPAILSLGGWNLHSFVQVGMFHILGAAEYASGAMALSARLTNLGITMAFIGGTFWFPMVIFPFLLKRLCRGAWIILIPVLLIVGVLLWMNLATGVTYPAAVMIQWFWMALAGGVMLAALFQREKGGWPPREEIVLLAWLGLVVLFTVFCNWTVSARALLPGLPPALILVARRMKSWPLVERFRLLVPVTGLLLSLPLAWVDMGYADSAREVAREMTGLRGKVGTRLWFSGHWGLQHYMESAGFVALDYEPLQLASGRDDILFPVMNNANARPVLSHRGVVWRRRVENPIGMTCHSLKDQAGFYSSQFGILPFGISRHAAELYLLMSDRPQDQLQ